MSAQRFQFTIDHEVGDAEIELVVTYSVTPFIEATYWQPAEGGEVEIQSITHNGQPYELTSKVESRIEALCAERVGEDLLAAAADEADWHDQCRRDDLMMAKWEDQ